MALQRRGHGVLEVLLLRVEGVARQRLRVAPEAERGPHVARGLLQQAADVEFLGSLNRGSRAREGSTHGF